MNPKVEKNLSETIPGGIYLDPKRGYVNADGEPINPDGSKRVELCNCTSEKPFITVDYVPDSFFHSKESISANGDEKTIVIKRVRSERITIKSATKKANEIYDETGNLKETEIRLTDWIDEQLEPKKGRPSGSKNKDIHINILSKIEKFIWDESANGEEIPKLKNVAKRFKINERTLRRMIRDKYGKNWKQFIDFVNQ